MLVLARKQNQNIIIDGKIIIRVLRVGRDNVKLGIEAPLTVPIHREEVFAAQVIVALLYPGIDAGCIDGDLHGRGFNLLRVELDLGLPFIEEAMTGDEAGLRHKINLAVGGFD